MGNKKNILFSSRVNYSQLFPKLCSEEYNSYHIVLNKKEKKIVENHGGNVIACFEEEYPTLEKSIVPKPFLKASYYSDRALWLLDIQDRETNLGKSITFWRNIFKKFPCDLLIHETIAIEFEEVMMLIAKDYNIKIGSFLLSPLKGHFFWKESSYHSSFSKEYLNKIQTTTKAQKIAHDFIQSVKNKGVNPDYLRNKPTRDKTNFIKQTLYPIKLRLYQLLKGNNDNWNIKEDAIFNHGHGKKNTSLLEIIKKQVYILKTDYDLISDYKEYNNILFPLHFEPEATLLYFNPQYAEQPGVIQRILKQLPSDTVLFIKEHPQQPGALMSPEYLALRKRNSNLKYLPAEYDSVSILSEINSLITISGTFGLEALIQQVPVIVFGNVFYDKHPDVYKPNQIEDLQNLLATPLKIPNDDNTQKYLETIFSMVYPGEPNFTWKYDDPNNIKNITQSIIHLINNTYPYE